MKLEAIFTGRENKDLKIIFKYENIKTTIKSSLNNYEQYQLEIDDENLKNEKFEIEVKVKTDIYKIYLKDNIFYFEDIKNKGNFHSSISRNRIHSFLSVINFYFIEKGNLNIIVNEPILLKNTLNWFLYNEKSFKLNEDLSDNKELEEEIKIDYFPNTVENFNFSNIRLINFLAFKSSSFQEFLKRYIKNREINQIILNKEKLKDLENIVQQLDIFDILLSYTITASIETEYVVEIFLKQTNISIVLDKDRKTIINFNKLSYGEKRLFFLIVYFMANNSVAILDEPSIALHYDFIEKLVSLINEANHQIFIANQNPLLLDFIEFNDNEEFKNKFVFCRKENNKMIWTNPTDEETEKFMEDYNNQFLTTSQILRFLNLW